MSTVIMTFTRFPAMCGDFDRKVFFPQSTCEAMLINMTESISQDVTVKDKSSHAQSLICGDAHAVLLALGFLFQDPLSTPARS